MGAKLPPVESPELQQSSVFVRDPVQAAIARRDIAEAYKGGMCQTEAPHQRSECRRLHSRVLTIAAALELPTNSCYLASKDGRPKALQVRKLQASSLQYFWASWHTPGGRCPFKAFS